MIDSEEDFGAFLDDDECGPPEIEVTLLMNGRVRREVQTLRSELDELEALKTEAAERDAKDAQSADTRMTETVRVDAETPDVDGRIAEIKEELARLDPDVRKYTKKILIRAMPPEEFNELFNEHPPRIVDGRRHPHDTLGVNQSTFVYALVGACIVKPVMDEAMFAKFKKKINDRQIDKLFNAAWSINRTDEDIPFLSAA